MKKKLLANLLVVITISSMSGFVLADDKPGYYPIPACEESEPVAPDEDPIEIDLVDVSNSRVALFRNDGTQAFQDVIDAFTSGVSNVTVPGTFYLDSDFKEVEEDKAVLTVEISSDADLTISSTKNGDRTHVESKDVVVYGKYIRSNVGEPCTRSVYNMHLKYNEPNTVLSSIDITVKRPFYGDTVTVINGEQIDVPDVTTSTQGIVIDSAKWITGDLGSEEPVETFYGTFEKGKDYYVIIHVDPEEAYDIDPDGVKINGSAPTFRTNHIKDWYFHAKIEPSEAPVEYSLVSDNNLAMAIFNYEKDHDFVLSFKDVLSMTSEEIESAYGLSEEDFNTRKEFIANSLKEYGTLLGLYDIAISDGTVNYSDALTLKIKLTEALKKYSKLQFVYLDNDDNFAVDDVKELTIGSETADIDLDHLSVYALVGSNEEEAIEEPETVATEEATETENPKTGDSIVSYVSLLLLSVLSILGIGSYIRSKETNC